MKYKKKNYILYDLVQSEISLRNPNIILTLTVKTCTIKNICLKAKNSNVEIRKEQTSVYLLCVVWRKVYLLFLFSIFSF